MLDLLKTIAYRIYICKRHFGRQSNEKSNFPCSKNIKIIHPVNEKNFYLISNKIFSNLQIKNYK